MQQIGSISAQAVVGLVAQCLINPRMLLLARIHAFFPVRCPKCAGAMRIIGFVTDAATVRDMLVHLGGF